GWQRSDDVFLVWRFRAREGRVPSERSAAREPAANVRNQVSRLLDIAVSTGYVSSDLGLPQNDNNSAGIASSGLLGCAQLACPIDTAKHGYGFLTPEQA